MDKLKVMFFDMGNTLLHFHRGKTDDEKDIQGLKYLTEYLNKLNPQITFNEVRENFFEGWMEGIKDRKIMNIEYPIEGFLNSFLKKYNLELSLNECIDAINLFYTEYREQVYFEEDILDTLRYIRKRGYKIGVISNTCYYDDVMKECFKKAGIYDLIDNFIFSYSLQIGKPNIEIFNIAIDKMNINPSEAVMIGDNLEKDIKPALKLGMKTIWLNTNNNKTTKIKPHIEISSLSEIKEVINGINLDS